jgi:cytochrome c-type biogenesis protein CcsB
MNTKMLGWATVIYLVAMAFYLIRLLRDDEYWGKLATGTALFGLVLHTIGIGVRWWESYRLGIGHAPLANFYESMIFFSWAIMVLYLVMEWRIRNRVIGPFVTPVAFLSMAYASLSPDQATRIQPLIPALQSNWLTSHVVTCFMGYGAFTIAFGLGILFFARRFVAGSGNPSKTRGGPFPDEGAIEELIYHSTIMGFIFLSLGIITGAVWANFAWGSYWSWDPKETWSLITWLIYAALLHARLVRGWRGKRIAVMAIAGFVSVLFTYLGVNYLDSLHSYIM